MADVPPPYQPPYQPYQAGPQNSNSAIISLIAGILGLTLLPGVASIVAVILGHMAKREIATSQGTLAGDGMATAGLILGYIGVGLMVLGLLFGCALLFGVCTLPFLMMPWSETTSWAPVLLAV